MPIINLGQSFINTDRITWVIKKKGGIGGRSNFRRYSDLRELPCICEVTREITLFVRRKFGTRLYSVCHPG